jgi:hypothetical protein
MWRDKALRLNVSEIVNIVFELAQISNKNVFREDIYTFTEGDISLIPFPFNLELDLIIQTLTKSLIFDECGNFLELLNVLGASLNSEHFLEFSQVVSKSNLIKIPSKDELNRLHQEIKIAVKNNYNENYFTKMIETEPLLSFNYKLSQICPINLIHYLLIKNNFIKKEISYSKPDKQIGVNFDSSLNLPKRIPTIELGLIENEKETNIGVLNQRINYDGNYMPIPMIYQYHVVGYYQFNKNLQTLLTENHRNVGEIYYKYILYVFKNEENIPCLIIGAETNPYLLEKITSSASPNEDVNIALFLGLFRPGGRDNLGLYENLNTKEEFVIVAHDIVQQFFNLDTNLEIISVNVDEQQKFLENKLKQAFNYINSYDYEYAYSLLSPLLPKLKESAYINHFSESLLYIATCCIELMKYEEAIVYIEEGILLEMNRGKPDNVATFLCELGKIAYLQKNFQQAKLLCEQALSIKVTIFPRVVKSGLAIYTKFLNNEVESELYLLALISLESNALDSCEKLLDLLRANSERKFYARMLGKAFDMLSIVAFQKGDYRKSITLLVNSLKTKYETGDYAGIIVSSAILQLYFLNEELGIYASFLQQKLDALRI